MNDARLLLVGDNPFHGISHLSQERAISRGSDLTNPKYAAGLVRTALENGANGFMFSVSDTTLHILRLACEGRKRDGVQLYALAPYVFQFVRMAVTEGGIPGLSKKMGREIFLSANVRAISQGFKGLVSNNPASLFKAYILYEESRIRSAAGKGGTITSILLHEVITDLALALDMDWLIRAHINVTENLGIKAGFHTHNLPHLVKKLKEWDVDCRKLVITTQFNSMGFGMCPSREECEEVLKTIPETEVIAYGILASGYLKLPEAVEYVKSLPQLKGIAVGVSKEHHARESFRVIKETL